MPILKILSACIATSLLVGCAHPLMINPDLAKIERKTASQPIPRNVGYYIADDARAREVTTPGGGGDKVTYLPYRDLEIAFYKMLSNVFSNVTRLKAPNDAEMIAKNNIHYVITPEIMTSSFSDSVITWPPTHFTVDLSCTIADAKGKPVFIKKVSGDGRASFDEFKGDFSLSGRRASEDAILKMQQSLLDAAALRQ